MIELLYRIYQVADDETKAQNLQRDTDMGLYSSVSKAENTEITMDCMVCESRNHFKEIIKDTYGDIPFRYSKKLSPGDLYCVIIGEHCYNTEKYFNKVSFKCDFCGSDVTTYLGNPICFSDSEIKYSLYGIEKYKTKRFCSNKCASSFKEREKQLINPDDEDEMYIERDMFTNSEINGYIYKITKKTTGEFYVGQTMHAPIFRWGQHLKSTRFPIDKITDYQFETLEVVPKNVNILEREKYWIERLYLDNPESSLNISATKNAKEKAALKGQLSLFDTETINNNNNG